MLGEGGGSEGERGMLGLVGGLGGGVRDGRDGVVFKEVDREVQEGELRLVGLVV
jgi:hypothetical protein